MANLSAMTIDQLLDLAKVKNDYKHIDWIPSLTQLGIDKANDELSAIESELDSRQPGVEFRTLYGERVLFIDFVWCLEQVGFEPIYGDYSD